jgi:hypothetical protein
MKHLSKRIHLESPEFVATPTQNLKSSTVRRLVALSCGGLLMVSASLLPVGSAWGANSYHTVANSDQSVAVVSPLLELLAFGASVGTPLACSTALSAVAEGAAQVPGLASKIAKELNDINVACATFATDGTAALTSLNTQLAVLEAANSYVVPIFNEFADLLILISRDYGSGLSPFGSTILALSGDVTWLSGA